jgi:type II secretory pathway pseudopilin PulG
MKLHRQIRHRHSEQGYILLTLLLVVTMMTIAAAVIVSDLKFEMKRDREEEMIHRGVQYSRAVRAYYKKFSRYPAKIEDLESSNRLRFLRKRYKDPLNCAQGKCADFKLLHYGEVQMSGNALGIPGATMTGTNAAVGVGPGASPGDSSAPAGSDAGSDTSQQSSSVGTVASQPGTQNGFSGPGGTGSSGFGNSSFGNSGFGNSSFGSNGPGGSGPGGSSSSSGGFLSGNNNTTFGGAPIVGVASDLRCPPHKKDECLTIREYDKKKKYNEWKFVYDPTLDRGALITTPYQSQIPGFGGQTPNLNGQNNGSTSGSGNGFGSSGFGSSGFGSSGFGSSGFGNSGFGNNSGLGNSSFSNTPGFGNSPSSGGSGNQSSSQSNSQQQ